MFFFFFPGLNYIWIWVKKNEKKTEIKNWINPFSMAFWCQIGLIRIEGCISIERTMPGHTRAHPNWGGLKHFFSFFWTCTWLWFIRLYIMDPNSIGSLKKNEPLGNGGCGGDEEGHFWVKDVISNFDLVSPWGSQTQIPFVPTPENRLLSSQYLGLGHQSIFELKM